MVNQMPNAKFHAFSILNEHSIGLESSYGPIEGNNWNAAILEHLQSSAVTA
jgi:hypothetical protein